MSQTHRILIVGGCYAGLAAATNLLDLSEGRPPRFAPIEPAPTTRYPLEITIVDERDGYYHVIGSPLALAKESFTTRAWTRFQDVPGLQHPGIKVVHGSVNTVDTDTKTASITLHNSKESFQQEYDYFIAASGLRRVWPVVPRALTREAYLAEANDHIAKVKAAKHGIVVIGGGAVGIEMAAELKLVYPSMTVTLIHSRDRLLSSESLPDDFKDETLSLLRSVGVETVMGKRVNHISEPSAEDGTISLTLSDDSQMTTSFVINAISRSTSTSSYLPTSVIDDQGHVKIEPTLHFLPSKDDQTEEAFDPYHFAAGDIASWSGIRRCGAAMHMGVFAAYNINAHITSILNSTKPEASELKSLSVHPPMIGLALGSTGIAYSPTEGTKAGPDILKIMFQDDLGFSICWNYMRLGEAPPTIPSQGGDGDVVHAGPADVVKTPSASEVANISSHHDTVANRDDGEPKKELSLSEWIIEAKSSHSRTSSTSATANQIPTIEDEILTSPTLSAASSSTSSESIAEPYTPFDAAGNANVTNFEALESVEVEGTRNELEVRKAIEGVRLEEEVPSTKVSPIRVVEGERV